MKINLILPPQPFLGAPERNAPLGIMYLAAVLEKNNHEVVITDLRKEQTNIEEADLFGFSCTTPEYNSCVKIAKKIKLKYPKSFIAIGGIHPTVAPVDKIFNFVCRGEGELGILKIIKKIENFDFNTKIVITKSPDIDLLPLPARHLLPSIVSTDFVEPGKRATSIIASRGCAYNCPFCCSRKFWGRQIRYRSIDKIIIEIKFLKKEYGIEQLRFHDDGFTTAKKSWLFNLCDEIKNLKIKYRINARIDHMPEAVLKKLYESGCIDIGYGIESVEQHVLHKCDKRISVKQIQTVLKDTKAAGIKTRIFLIAGLPGQSVDSHKKTIDFIKETQPDTVDISTLVPYPGSPYYDNPKKFGIKLKDISFDDYVKQLGFYKNELDKDFVFEHDILNSEQLKYSRAKVHEYVSMYKMDNSK